MEQKYKWVMVFIIIALFTQLFIIYKHDNYINKLDERYWLFNKDVNQIEKRLAQVEYIQWQLAIDSLEKM